jgi:predicted Rossmann-fold nucleotide-binding protein
MSRDYWGGLLDWLRHRVAAEGKIDLEDIDLLHLTDDPTEAVRVIVDAEDRAGRSRNGARATP